MRKTALVLFTIMALFVQKGFSRELATVQDGNITVFIHGVESGDAFPAYARQSWPSEITQVQAHKGTKLVLVHVVVKNNSRSKKERYRLGDIQLNDGKRKYRLVAVGFSDKPAVVKETETKKRENQVEMVDPTVYLFPHYIFEVPSEGRVWNVSYKDKMVKDLMGAQTKGD
jgi:hypothetical protein